MREAWHVKELGEVREAAGEMKLESDVQGHDLEAPYKLKTQF